MEFQKLEHIPSTRAKQPTIIMVYSINDCKTDWEVYVKQTEAELQACCYEGSVAVVHATV